VPARSSPSSQVNHSVSRPSSRAPNSHNDYALDEPLDFTDPTGPGAVCRGRGCDANQQTSLNYKSAANHAASEGESGAANRLYEQADTIAARPLPPPPPAPRPPQIPRLAGAGGSYRYFLEHPDYVNVPCIQCGGGGRLDLEGECPECSGTGTGAGTDDGAGPEIPLDASEVLEEVDRTGEPPEGYADPHPFENDGRGNGQRLPENDEEGRPITYKTYDVKPYTPGVNRGAERLVVGSDGSAYYTSDHYGTFTQIQGRV
jgi:guanyl-specific ribonuclease Sa